MVDVGRYGLSERAVSESVCAVLGDGLYPDFGEAAVSGHFLWEAGVLGVEVYGHGARRFGGPWGTAGGGFGFARRDVYVDGAEGFEFHV